jgi:hypothetical protein
MMKRSTTPGKKDGQNKPSSPSFFQRIASFIDSPCSLGIAPSSPSASSDEAPREDTGAEAGNVTSVRVKSIKSQKSNRQIRNRSSAPRQIRQQRLNELNNGLSLHSHVDFNNPSPSPSFNSPTLRRVKSLTAAPTPSPTSVADTSSFWTYSTDQGAWRSIQDCCPANPPRAGTFAGNEGIFSSVGWCCNDITTAATFDHHLTQAPSTVQEGCDGYVDYVGTHHPHTLTNCQGCIFRKSLFDGSEMHRDEDLYYDSDCDDLLGKESRGNFITGTMHQQMAPMSRSKKIRKSFSPIVDAQHQGQPSPERQTYMYDYFMRNSNNTAPLRTGICATAETDIGDCVQVSFMFK